MTFSPIAIVGRSCILPNALNPAQLWKAVSTGQDLISNCPDGRWRVSSQEILTSNSAETKDKAFSKRGGYVRGFEQIWEPDGFALDAAEFDGLDPSFLWALHCAREALRDSGDLRSGKVDRSKVGAILGNLGFPTSGMSDYAESQWLQTGNPDPRNRFMSSGIAKLLEEALGLAPGLFCLDTACASSLYAIKLACDQLHDGTVDMVLAGAINRADDLFIHVGFTALKALSPTGESRPFHAEANGLVPAEGAGIVALKRLADAQRDGNTIYGVIRGIGLSNDGRGRGFLAPSSEGQIRALKQAYTSAGISPKDVSLLECHATGTTLGDTTEIQSTASLYQGCDQVPIGSLKSNMGHLITTAGVAALIKVIEAMRHGQRPPTLHSQNPSPALQGSPFRLLSKCEPWISNGQKIAGISAFGFGGNNAHLLVSENNLPASNEVVSQIVAEPLALVAAGVVVGEVDGLYDFKMAVENNISLITKGSAGALGVESKEITLGLKGLRFPPKDLNDTLGQQLLILKAAREAISQCPNLPNETTGVFMGMEPDVEVCRYGLRWRLNQKLKENGKDPQQHQSWIAKTKENIIPPLSSAGVVGTMPNIPANRLNSQFDFGGASLSISSGESSGIQALQLAGRALYSRELDAVLVCAVDLSCQEQHIEALANIEGQRTIPGDAAVALVLKRLSDAERDGDKILARLDQDPPSAHNSTRSFNHLFGRSWTAGGLRDLLASALTLEQTQTILHHGQPLFSMQKGNHSPVEKQSLRNTPNQSFPAHPKAFSRTVLSQIIQPKFGLEIPMQNMPSAPKLPSIIEGVEAFPAAQLPPQKQFVSQEQFAPKEQSSRQANLNSQPSTVAIQGVSQTNMNPKMTAAHQLFQQMGNSLKAHLERQMEVHQGFMRLQNNVIESLVNNGSASPQAVVVQQQSPNASVSELGGGYHQQPTPTIPMNNKAETPIFNPVVKKSPATASLQKKRQSIKTSTPQPKPPTGQLVKPRPTGPTFSWEQLKIHASGKISEIFGSKFQLQDGYHRQVRMPEAPLLLAERITGLDAEAGLLGQGTIWSETDVAKDGWYLHQGHMPAGVMIESGQADLMLISYMGVDFSNQGKRVYRLLGCELTYHGGLPKVGDTLVYDIHMDNHATQGDVRLMFFHYDCQVNGQNRLSVRKGQAGFFTDAELADSDGCLWTPEEQQLVDNPRVDSPAIECSKSDFSAEEVRAFADGKPWVCFGPGFELTKPHTRSPRIQNGKMLLIGDISQFNSNGGPWGNGYLKSTVQIDPDLWFFDGHFKNDSCMPGTLMFEGCLQAMGFYLAAMGYTIDKDGWRFEPVSDIPFALKCRGQVTPRSKVLTYEVFVEEVHDGPTPTLYADLLCTIDGLKGFHARRVGLQLIPAWPLDEGSPLLEGYVEAKEVAKAGDFAFDYRSMLACANGKPSEAFGPIYSRFDAPGRVARLPNPPYLFQSRVMRTKGVIGSMENGMEVDIEYDIPADAWYFDENGCRVMPYAVLLEAALQPCGWLASYMGCALTVERELCFRNLDGTGKCLVDILPDSGTLLTKVKSTSTSKTASMIIVSFKVECLIDRIPVYEMETVFGFFPEEALSNQVGLPTTVEQRAVLEAPVNHHVDLTLPPKSTTNERPKLAQPKLMMLDRIAYFEPNGGQAGLGLLRGEKDVDPGEWFFKAHFFQDPVQPGSLGIEAMIQLLQWYMLEKNLDDGIANPRFEAMANNEPMTWKYRGQVVPKNKLISSTIEIVEIRREERSVLVLANSSLWVDGKRIYEATNLGMRIVSGGDGEKPSFTVDPEKDGWINDHCPTWTVPALPMMSVVDLLAQGASTLDPVCTISDVRIKSWLTFDQPQTLRTERNGEQVRLLLIGDGEETEVASAKIQTGEYPSRPDEWKALTGQKSELPYKNGDLFHGPAFQCLTALIQNQHGASSTLKIDGDIPLGRLNPLILDGATHGIPHDRLHLWDPIFSPDKVAYPALIPEMNFYGPTPKNGAIRCEVRPDGYLGDPSFPAFRIQLIGEQGVWCSFRLIEAAFPKGKIGGASPENRRSFLRDKQFIAGLRLSEEKDSRTILREEDVTEISWLPGTVKAIFGSESIADIAQKEHIAAAHHIHPLYLPEALPLTQFELNVQKKKGLVMVEGSGLGRLNIEPVRDFWSNWFNRGPWAVEDLYYGLCQRFINRVVLADPESFEAYKGQSMLFVANHQVGVESLLFSIIASGLSTVPTVTLAKIEHKETWLGKLIDHCFRYPNVQDPKVITFFDRQDKSSLTNIIKEFAQEMATNQRSIMIHIEGTRSLDCATPVQKMSGAFLDMAIQVGAPVVPVRFVGGLPREKMEKRIEFPINMGKQDIYFGKPISAAELSSLHYGDRKNLVIDAINDLGPNNADEQPYPGDSDFSEKVARWQKKHTVTEEHAALACILSEQENSCEEIQRLLKATTLSELADGEIGNWLTELGRRLIGET